MSRWDRREPYRKQARDKGYRARAAYKLLEIEKRFQILQGVQKIVDLCCAPGSWLQVVTQHCKESGLRIIGVDTAPVKPIQDVKIIKCSIDALDLASRIREQLGGLADLILSDCSPKLTGNKTLDRERQVYLAKRSLALSLEILSKGKHFVTKIFQSEQTGELVATAKNHFEFIRLFKPSASLPRSPEMYLIAKYFRASAK
ncbi:MAG: SAM-dependent methyltransferase [Promethearchaeota archaeon]